MKPNDTIFFSYNKPLTIDFNEINEVIPTSSFHLKKKILHISTIKFIFFSFFSVCEKCIEKKVSLHPVYYSNFKQGSKELIPKEFYFIFLYHQKKIFFLKKMHCWRGRGGWKCINYLKVFLFEKFLLNNLILVHLDFTINFNI